MAILHERAIVEPTRTTINRTQFVRLFLAAGIWLATVVAWFGLRGCQLHRLDGQGNLLGVACVNGRVVIGHKCGLHGRSPFDVWREAEFFRPFLPDTEAAFFDCWQTGQSPQYTAILEWRCSSRWSFAGLAWEAGGAVKTPFREPSNTEAARALTTRGSGPWAGMGMGRPFGPVPAATPGEVLVAPWWFVTVPVWPAVVISSWLLGLSVLQFSRRLRQQWLAKHNRCIRCGYDLRASSGKCPECGTPIPERMKLARTGTAQTDAGPGPANIAKDSSYTPSSSTPS